MSLKRPHPSGEDHTGRDKKKQKTANARVIHFQSGASSGTGVVTSSIAGLPGAIDVEKFTEARSFEIAAMQSAMETAQGSSTQRAWQALPRSLRRRAASHDVRRVPVRLREKARAEMDPVKKKALNKKPGKKGKSKAITRTESFLKRQRDKKWLETHIWHTKRMHMKNVWGYRLAETPTDKSYRPSHRASLHGSMLHDASYIGTISMSGRQSILERLLARCCDFQGAGSSAVRFTLGSRIQETHLYKPDAYPFGLIAPITILWKPLNCTFPSEVLRESNTESGNLQSKPKQRKRGGKATGDEPLKQKPDPASSRTVWIRIHPSAWDEAWNTLQEAASLTLKEFRHEQQATRASLENVQEDNITKESIEMTDLRSQLNCFELTGPRTSQILKGVFRPINGDDRQIFKEFWAQLKNLQSSGSVPRGMVIGFKVYDPRLNFPPKNAKAEVNADGGLPSTSQSATFTVFPSPDLAKTELWDDVEREEGCRQPRFQKKDIDYRRSKNMVPGTPLMPLRQDDRIPLILIQRTVGPTVFPPDRGSGPGNMHGWTVLFPAHWGMTLLTSLVHTGTRVGGLRERRTQAFEAGTPDFPFDYPLTKAYESEEAKTETYEKERWAKKPPAKRVAWDVVGTRSPFRTDWEVVLGFPPRKASDEGLLDVQRDVHVADPAMEGEQSDSRDGQDTMWLLRGPGIAEILRAAQASTDSAALFLNEINVLRSRRNKPPLGIDSETLLKGALIQVKLNMCGRGSPGDLAAIYHVGEEEANKIREILAKKKEGDLEGGADAELSELSANESDIIGYVTTGDYSLSRGRGFAVGSVSGIQLIRIWHEESRQNTGLHCRLVKVKDRESTVCRAATLDILTGK